MNEVFDSATEKYFDAKFQNLNDKIDTIETTILKDVEHHRGDIEDLYDKDRDTKERLTVVETTLKNHTDTHLQSNGNKQWTMGQIVTIVVCVAAIVAAKFL